MAGTAMKYVKDEAELFHGRMPEDAVYEKSRRRAVLVPAASGVGGSGLFTIQRRSRNARWLNVSLPNRAVPKIVSTTVSSTRATIQPSRGCSTERVVGAPIPATPGAADRQGLIRFRGPSTQKTRCPCGSPSLSAVYNRRLPALTAFKSTRILPRFICDPGKLADRLTRFPTRTRRTTTQLTRPAVSGD
jgi:hypothetical protein